MSLEAAETQMGEYLDSLSKLDATVKFECKNEGVIFLDATESPAVLSHEDDAADCTIRITSDNLIKLMNGKLDPMLAYTMGKLKIKGSMGVAMKLTGLLN